MAGPFDRAWSRRPFVSPARWMPMASVPDLWAETLVTFSRVGGIATPGGGIDSFAGGGQGYLTAQCHVEVNEETTANPMAGGDALVVARYWMIFLPLVVDDVPLDPANYPRKGDRVQFTDDLGRSINMDINGVTSPDTIGDHLEIVTSTFE